jgi:flagellar biogenesis protein FliO
MSMYEVINTVFTSMMFVIALITVVIHLVKLFSKRK